MGAQSLLFIDHAFYVTVAVSSGEPNNEWRIQTYFLRGMERETGIEPATSSLGSWRSTAELLPLATG